MSANLAFCLFAGVMSLIVVVLTALKGDWIVVIVYGMLAVGFAGRATLGRRSEPPPTRPQAPRHDERLKSTRFRRR